MTIRNSSRFAAGFSLLEVLIAVVVLSFGLLALTALQSRIFQASAEAKAQSVALELAKSKMEDMRSFMSMGQYQALVSGNDSSTVDGTTYRRDWTVKRFAVPVGGTTFQQYGTLTGNLPATYSPNREFKTVTMAVTWTDASGQNRAVRMEDAIAGIDPQDSARNQRSRSGRSRGPIVRIYDPGSESGVIPIAVGDGSETAATNPKPIVAGRDSSVTETRFDVITYSGLAGGVATAQARVETTVVGCKCTMTANSSSVYYRPTYWNGRRYAVPEAKTGNAPARAATLRNNDPPQSRYCDTCCRDHHDVNVASGDPKVSPYRASHTHQIKENGTWRPVAAGETYFEACRLIRVDGIFDVAADLSNDAYNLLETASTATSPTPSANAQTAYETFVLDYLNNRYVTGTSYNTRVAPTTAQMAPLDVPASISIARTNDQRWLHSRGLYIDYLEQEARDAIVDAKAACRNSSGGDPTATDLRTCVLKVLPFTSINLTEVADWSSSATAQISVSNNNFSTADTSNNPVRGGVTPGTSPTNNAQANAITVAGHSTSGLLGIAGTWPINSEEDPYTTPASTLAKRDTQLFELGGGSPPGNNGGTFTVAFATGFQPNSSSPPVISFDLPSRATCNVSAGGMTHTCSTQSGLGGSVPVRVENYNTSASDLRANPCKTNQNEAMPYRIVYDVTSIVSNNASAVVGAMSVLNNDVPGGYSAGEYTQATTTPIANGDILTVTMSSPSFLCPSTYTCDNGNKVNYSTTYTTCPSNVRPDAAPVGQ